MRAFRCILVTAVLAVIVAAPALAQSALPNSARTPGALNPAVTQETIGETICMRGWTRTVRPPKEFTSALKRQQIRQWRYADRRMSDYEEDHLLSGVAIPQGREVAVFSVG